jgi:hypothetical protein
VAPGTEDLGSEAVEAMPVGGHSVVREINADHGLDFLPLLRHWQKALPKQILTDYL